MPRTTPTATISVAESDEGLVLHVRGELDLTSRDDIEPVIMVALAVTPAVIVDLAELEFCDSQGLAMIIACMQQAAAGHTAFTLANPRPQVQRLLEITDLTRLLPSA